MSESDTESDAAICKPSLESVNQSLHQPAIFGISLSIPTPAYNFVNNPYVQVPTEFNP